MIDHNISQRQCKIVKYWYHLQQIPSGIAMLTPRVFHYGLAADVLDNRQCVLTAAFQQRPESFVRKPLRPALAPGCRLHQPAHTRPAGGRRDLLVHAGKCLKVANFRYSNSLDLSTETIGKQPGRDANTEIPANKEIG